MFLTWQVPLPVGNKRVYQRSLCGNHSFCATKEPSLVFHSPQVENLCLINFQRLSFTEKSKDPNVCWDSLGKLCKVIYSNQYYFKCRGIHYLFQFYSTFSVKVS